MSNRSRRLEFRNRISGRHNLLVLPRSRVTDKQVSRCRASQAVTARRLCPSEVLTVGLFAAPVSHRSLPRVSFACLGGLRNQPPPCSPRVASECSTLQDPGDGPRREGLPRTLPVRPTLARACGVDGSCPAGVWWPSASSVSAGSWHSEPGHSRSPARCAADASSSGIQESATCVWAR